jgi:hypothetical protein
LHVKKKNGVNCISLKGSWKPGKRQSILKLNMLRS